MTRTDIPATPARTVFHCDGCGLELQPGQVDAKIEFMDRDFQGGIVYSHMKHLCQQCRRGFGDWLEEWTTNANR